MLSVATYYEDVKYYIVLYVRQKTAYEVRISDWSPDVSSSDLFAEQPAQGGLQHALFQRLDGDHMLARPRRLALLGPARAVALRRQHIADAAMAVADRQQQAPHATAALLGPLPRRFGIERPRLGNHGRRSEEHTSELQSLMRTSYAVF